MENILVAFSNFYGIYPIITSYMHNDLITLSIVLNVVTMSFLSHLFEVHKHNMPGFIIRSNELSYFLNKLDVLGVILVFVRCLFLFDKIFIIHIYDNYKYHLIGALIFNLISEYDKESKYFYIITHICWHILIFYLMDIILNDYYH